MAALGTLTILTKSPASLLDLCKQSDTQKPSRWSLCPQKSDNTCLNKTIEKMISLRRYFKYLIMLFSFTTAYTATLGLFSNTKLLQTSSCLFILGSFSYISFFKIQKSLAHLIAYYNPTPKK